MTEYELNALIILSAEKSGEILEFWVSISFAVVVASFFISKQINLKIFKIMGFLYLLSSVFMAAIYVGAALRANYYFSQLVVQGLEKGHFDNPVNYVTLLFAFLLFFGGTCGTLYYMKYCANDKRFEGEST